MASQKRMMRFRTKLILWLAMSAAAAAGLLVASAVARPAPKPSPAVATAPADRGRRSSQEAAAERLAGLLLLFSLISVSVTVVCTIWLVVDIRNSRPAWMTQTRYPRRR
jgi:hypothetical protein